VIVLEDGRILEEGAPQKLIQAGGRFAALLELEAAGWDWREETSMQTRSNGAKA
jgi:ATP-binding cassette subfamily B protein